MYDVVAYGSAKRSPAPALRNNIGVHDYLTVVVIMMEKPRPAKAKLVENPSGMNSPLGREESLLEEIDHVIRLRTDSRTQQIAKGIVNDVRNRGLFS